MRNKLDDLVRRVEENLGKVIRGKPESIRHLVICMLSGGHTLLEDVPGTGKTTLAKSLARSINGTFRRVQFTPDLLPADIIGSSIYNPKEGTFSFREGPVFANILLADEINRTSPRTQSALLEVMSENQVTVEGMRRELPQPFCVVATQNPAEYHGTYPLPEAQLDRFTMKITMGYPDADHEMDILYGHNDRSPFDAITPVIECSEIIAAQDDAKTVTVDRSIAEYILRIVNHTRSDSRLKLGISTRGSLALYRTAQVRAAIEGRDYVAPADVRELAPFVLAHRVMLDTRAKYSGVDEHAIIREALENVPEPR